MTTLQQAWAQFKRERSITLCPTSLTSDYIEAQIPVAQVAAWAGNSSEVIWKHYCNVTQEYEMPTL